MDLEHLLQHKIDHLGYIVDDIPRAVDAWRKQGIGPFFGVEHVEFEEVRRPGSPCVFDHSAAFARFGEIGLELHQIHHAEPLEFAREMGCNRGNGLNHIAFALEDPEAQSRWLTDNGYPLAVYCQSGPIQDRMHYIPELGHVIELHLAGDTLTQLWEQVAAASANWDGTEPLRPLELG